MRTAVITGLLALTATVAAISVIATPSVQAQTLESTEFHEQYLPDEAVTEPAMPEVAVEEVPTDSEPTPEAAPKDSGLAPEADISDPSSGQPAAEDPASEAPAEVQIDLGTFKTTSYSLRGVMKGGDWVYYGAVAVDPRVIPLGSTIYIEDLGYFVAEDTGGAVKGSHIDIWLPTRSEALTYGVQYRRAWLVG